MKRLLMIVGCVALPGCATRRVIVVAEREDRSPGIVHLEAKHAHLKSVLCIDDMVLADTNRFMLGEGDYGQAFKLDKPFGGFVEARVYLDRMEYPPLCTTDGKPHRLRSVELTRRLPDDSTEKDIISEWQSACEFVSEILDVESPKVSLVDVEKWRKGMEGFRGLGAIRSCMTFNLADDQYISVRLIEPMYAMRGGNAVVARPGYVEIDLMFNHSLCIGGIRNTDAGEKAEREIEFGPDCCDKLAKALKDGIERRTQRAKRKQNKR